MKIYGALRQLAYPKEFRIQPDEFGLPFPAFAKLEQRVIEVLNNIQLEPEEGMPSKFVAELSSNIWRINKRINLASDTGIQQKTVTGIHNLVNRLYKLLESYEIEIQDYSGDRFDQNEIWDDVSGNAEDTVGVIQEMARPRILYKGTVIQRGMPIIGKG